jgi:hypothetical protein
MKTRLVFMLIGIAVGGFVVICALLYCVSLYEDHRRARALEFIDQVIVSAMDGTLFYREHSDRNVAKDIEAHAADFTRLYRVQINDKTFGSYECAVTFQNHESFEILVILGGKNRIGWWRDDSFFIN